MPRDRTYTIGCLNIRVHTKHEPAEYLALWRALARLQQPYVWPSSTALMIGESARLANAPSDGFYGSLYRFVQIDKTAPWFNLASHKPAEAEDLRAITLPPNLQPNLRQLPFYFDANKHRLYFVTRMLPATVTPAQVEKLITYLTQHASITERFGRVDVQIAASVESVERLLGWPVIRTLRIEVERPNATELSDDEDVLARLKSLGARRERREYTKADDAMTLVPDARLRALANVAADNGRVHVDGVDPQGRKASADSQDFPWSQRVRYSPIISTLTDSFLETVRDLFSRTRL